MVVTFACVEMGIDVSLSMIHDEFGGNTLGLELPRTALNRKLTYFRKALASDLQLPMKEAQSKLLDHIEKMADHRNNIIHSVVHITANPASGGHPISKYDHRKGLAEAELSVPNLRAFNIQVYHAATAAAAYAEILRDGLNLTDEENEAIRETLGKLP